MADKYNTDAFINKSKKVHGDKYNYDKSVYTGSRELIEIVCSTHGSFWQIAEVHYRGHNCPTCAGNKRLTIKNFIQRANVKFNSFYTYPDIIIDNGMNTKITIKCPIHGDFKKRAASHLQGEGCQKCSKSYNDQEYFIERSKIIHRNFYNYDDVHYNGSRIKVDIWCPIHGIFKQSPMAHLQGHGCRKCKSGGFRKDRPAILYYFVDTELMFYKIGITNGTVKSRFGNLSSRFKILKCIEFDDGNDAFNTEQFYLELFLCHRVEHPDFKNNGSTEFFDIDIFHEDML